MRAVQKSFLFIEFKHLPPKTIFGLQAINATDSAGSSTFDLNDLKRKIPDPDDV
jgi:hypothetical protein